MKLSTKRRALVVGGVAAAAGVIGVGTGLIRHLPTEGGGLEALDGNFWAGRFDRSDGGQLDFASFRGKPLLVNFWATWCPPCIEELPMIDRFFVDQAANGWQVVGLAVDQPAAVQKFLGKTPVTFPIGITGLAGTELMKQLGNTAGGLPFTLVVSAGGGVAARKMGKLEAADLDTWQRAQLHS
ncbi:TlpA family protein disulfide reductase [Variovorax sp. RHLX14]|uniref:TlpA family protein disulfide reductase n=1 Tax=Variovorax sp. RHLX14 TaxID=1259731 RepID=UPI003F468646